MVSKLVVVYYSRTGQTKRFVEKIGEELPDTKFYRIKGSELKEVVNSPYVLITPTYMQGNVPEQVDDFLEEDGNYNKLVAVVSSGNKNWGSDLFAGSGRKISNKYSVPLIHQYEMRGNRSDLEKVISELNKLNKQLKDE